ncbi:MAG: response regulator [Anaerolineae bacterium]|nr:response regulator [Anaerolineae bacterium]
MMNVPDDVKNWVVLLVDDESDNLGVAEKFLTFAGARVHSASNGVEGLDVLARVHPSVVLLDLSMPQMDGWTMLERIRANPEWDSLIVIAVTAHAMTGDKERVMKAGFDGYIDKPLRLATFLGDVRNWIEKTRQRRSPVVQGNTGQ